jgi:hypothetical protein
MTAAICFFERYATLELTPPSTDSGNLQKVSDWGMLGNGPGPTVGPGIVDTASHRHKISAFVAIEPGNTSQVKEAI